MKITILVFMMLTLTSCKAQNNLRSNTMNTFDIKIFNENKNPLNQYSFELENGTIIRQREDSDEYYEVIEFNNSYFNTINTYYFNGRLKSSVNDFPSSFFHGTYKEYDENGNLIKETDYDKGFDYTWDDLLKLLKERKVNIKDTANTTIRKANGNWRFDYIEGIYIYDVIVDGKTGKILQDAKNIFQEGS